MCSGDVLWVSETRRGHYGPTTTRRFYSNAVLCAQQVWSMNLFEATIQWTAGDGTLIASGSESYSAIPSAPVIPSVSCVARATVSMDAACPTWDSLEPNLIETDASTCATGTCADPDPSPYTRR